MSLCKYCIMSFGAGLRCEVFFYTVALTKLGVSFAQSKPYIRECHK